MIQVSGSRLSRLNSPDADLDIPICTILAHLNKTLGGKGYMDRSVECLHESQHQLTQTIIKGSRCDTTSCGSQRRDLPKGNCLIRIEDIFTVTGRDTFDIAVGIPNQSKDSSKSVEINLLQEFSS